MSAKNAELDRVSSHWITLGRMANEIDREECFPQLTATWRGQTVKVEMEANRYRHSSGMSEWRIFARSAYTYDEAKNGGRGEHVTDTARFRLSELCQPLVAEWLDSDAYQQSYKCALANAVMREFDDDMADRDVRVALSSFGAEMVPSHREAISAALMAREHYDEMSKAAHVAIRADLV